MTALDLKIFLNRIPDERLNVTTILKIDDDIGHVIECPTYIPDLSFQLSEFRLTVIGFCKTHNFRLINKKK